MNKKKRSNDDPARIAADNFTKARQELFIAMCKALYIDRFIEWLSKKLK